MKQIATSKGWMVLALSSGRWMGLRASGGASYPDFTLFARFCFALNIYIWIKQTQTGEIWTQRNWI